MFMNKQLIIAVFFALLVGAGVGLFLGGNGSYYSKPGVADNAEQKPLFYRNPMNPAITSPVPAKDNMGMDYIPVYAKEKPKEKKVLFYRNPMNPAITSPVPAKDDMGMDYIPVYEGGGAGDDSPAGTVIIDPVVAQNIGVRSALAVKKVLTHNIRTLGRLDYDERRITRLHPKVEGWIEKLFVDVTGAQVGRDTMLFSLYSPQLVSSEEEYLLALDGVETLKESSSEDIRKGAERLAAAALERLELFDVPEHQLEALKRDRKIVKNLHVHSPFKGVVISIGVREGQYVTPKTELYMIADLTRIWAYVDIYEDEMSWVQTGDATEMTVAGIPGRTFIGKITYIYPYLDPKTRTNKVRLEFNNPDLTLKPEMFANVTLKTSRQVNAIVIPDEAIVRTGAKDQIFIVKGEGRFEPREVKLGVATGGYVQVLEGVSAGERVVTSAQFLIDSESKLNEATAKMMEISKEKKSAPDPDMDMGGMKMDDMKMEHGK